MIANGQTTLVTIRATHMPIIPLFNDSASPARSLLIQAAYAQTDSEQNSIGDGSSLQSRIAAADENDDSAKSSEPYSENCSPYTYYFPLTTPDSPYTDALLRTRSLFHLLFAKLIACACEKRTANEQANLSNKIVSHRAQR